MCLAVYEKAQDALHVIVGIELDFYSAAVLVSDDTNLRSKSVSQLGLKFKDVGVLSLQQCFT